jgi:glutaryl-CoA dehydrogenase
LPRLQEIFGGNAVSDEYQIGRHVANLFVTQTYEGQSDIHGEYLFSQRQTQHWT